ncbi:hypothetical protein [Roseovarius aestuarii]|uniref:Uncharacterized protein n=1 Tax=Roseovarius aestuarii TaxID=475083 RepID=A0A1X7BQD2_9RHOB|nr:hypothetical protein [Roseovarius aestuarii]SMC11801.1 hypothetical protein ROA7745_01620 [Roseovarius aestuarii]
MPNDANEFLPSDALNGLSLGISVSDSADLPQLGLFEDHFRLALGEIARTILFAGGQLYYGGHLRDDGYTQFIVDELQRYGNRNSPFKVCLAYTEHQRLSAEEISKQEEHLGLFGEIIFLDEDGVPTDYSPQEDPLSFAPSCELLERSLSGLRNFLVRTTDARVVLGGKRTGFFGRYPGIIEEILVSVDAGKPLYLAGGFGGATLDAISILAPDNAAWFRRYETEQDDYQKVLAGLDALQEAATRSQDWSKNGLSAEENAILAATYRPSEISALVGHGLGKLNK